MGRVYYLAAVAMAALVLGAVPSSPIEAADVAYKARHYTASPHCREVWRCGPAGCGFKQVCWRRGCYDRYSCYPLYGAYGPYGGVAYWGAYSYNVWDP